MIILVSQLYTLLSEQQLIELIGSQLRVHNCSVPQVFNENVYFIKQTH